LAICTVLVLLATPGGIAAAPRAGASTTPAPTTIDLKSIVSGSLGQDRNYRPGDLITQKRVASVLAALKASGWEVPHSRELLARVPSDGEFLVRALSTEKGVAFMRTISRLGGGYDRVDRLSRIPNGRQLVERLIQGPDGHKLVVYLAESAGGKELGTMLGRATDTAEFNKPTGRIYTEHQLLAELEDLRSKPNK
jgi:hypothetical protein